MSWSRSAHADRWQKEFGQALRRVRLLRGLSQMDLAHAADIDPTYISAVEQGRRNISLVNIRALATALDVEVVEFFVVDPAEDSSGVEGVNR